MSDFTQLIPKKGNPLDILPKELKKVVTDSKQGIKFKENILMPFFFSKGCTNIKAPYVYGFILITLLIISVITFIIMVLSKKYSPGALGVFAGVIGTLAGLYSLIIASYNKGVQTKKAHQAEVIGKMKLNKTQSERMLKAIGGL